MPFARRHDGMRVLRSAVAFHLVTRLRPPTLLTAVPSLWPIRDLAFKGPWDFSIVRFMNARPGRARPQ